MLQVAKSLNPKLCCQTFRYEVFVKMVSHLSRRFTLICHVVDGVTFVGACKCSGYSMKSKFMKWRPISISMVFLSQSNPSTLVFSGLRVMGRTKSVSSRYPALQMFENWRNTTGNITISELAVCAFWNFTSGQPYTWWTRANSFPEVFPFNTRFREIHEGFSLNNVEFRRFFANIVETRRTHDPQTRKN